MAEKSEIKKEVDIALTYISIGCNKFYEEDCIDFKKINKNIEGLKCIQKGAYILNAISNLSNFKNHMEKFPTDLSIVLKLIEEKSIDEWVELYPFLKEYTKDLADMYYNFLDDVGLGEHDRMFKENSEYELFIKYNNDKNFMLIRGLAANDKEYAFSRVGIPTLLEGNALNINMFLKNKFKSIFGDENINEKLIEAIVNNYYRDVINLHKYYHTKEGYACCKHCGSLIQKKTKREDKYLCSFDICNDKHMKFNKKVEIGSYIKNPTKVLKYEVLRFVSYPSIEEWRFYCKLEHYEKIGMIKDLILYYNKDACDISFVFNNTRFAIDLKEWVRPKDLGKRISEENFKRNNKDAKCFIVIPEYLTKKSNGRKNDYMSVLKNNITGKAITEDEILTDAEFMKKFKRLVELKEKEKVNETELYIKN